MSAMGRKALAVKESDGVAQLNLLSKRNLNTELRFSIEVELAPSYMRDNPEMSYDNFDRAHAVYTMLCAMPPSDARVIFLWQHCDKPLLLSKIMDRCDVNVK